MTAIAWVFSILAGCFDGRLRIIGKRSPMPLLPLLFGAELLAIPVLAIVALFFGVPPSGKAFVVAMIGMGPFLALGFSMVVQGGRVGEISVTTVYLNLTPAFMLLTAAAMGLATPSVQGIVGIVLTIVGIYIVNVAGKTDRLWTPIVRAWRDQGARLVIGGAFFFSLTANLLAVMIENSNGPTAIVAMHVAGAFSLGSLLLSRRARNGITPAHLARHKGEVLEAAAAIAVGDTFLFLSYTLLPVMALAIIGKRVGTTFFTLRFAGEKTALGFRTVGAAIAVLGMTIVILWGKTP